MDRRCIAVGRVVAGRPIVERVDTTIDALFVNIARDIGRSYVQRIVEADGDCPECGSPLDACGRCPTPAKHGGGVDE